MKIRFYMDVHIPRAVTNGLRMRGIDVLTSQEDGTTLYEDIDLLERATELDRVLFTYDADLLEIASNKMKNKTDFPGLVFAHPIDITIGNCVLDLELIATVLEKNELKNQIIFLPL